MLSIGIFIGVYDSCIIRLFKTDHNMIFWLRKFATIHYIHIHIYIYMSCLCNGLLLSYGVLLNLLIIDFDYISFAGCEFHEISQKETVHEILLCC